MTHKHVCPQCGVELTCNNPAGCPGEGSTALCGSCPFVRWADLIIKPNYFDNPLNRQAFDRYINDCGPGGEE